MEKQQIKTDKTKEFNIENLISDLRISGRRLLKSLSSVNNSIQEGLLSSFFGQLLNYVFLCLVG